MDIIKAREIVRTLADGIDPTTGEVLPAESVYNSPEVIRALFAVLEASTPNAQLQNRNAGKPWTEIEEEKLIDEYASKIKIADIAKEHGRTYRAIESRLEHLGLKKKSFWFFSRSRKSK